MRRLLLPLIVLAGLGAGTAWAVTRPPASAARVLEQRFRSSALAATVAFRVYLPAGYATAGRRYPVVYLLHGLPSGSTAYRNARLSAVGRAAQAAGRPVIVVAPQGARAGDSDPEYHDWGAGRNWETAIARELVAAVDARFRTIADRSARAIIGVSAGGYGAAAIAVHNPQTFSVSQAWSGCFRPTNPSGSATLSVGSADDDRRASVHSFVAWLARTRAVRLSFYVGDADRHFVGDNRRLHRELARAGVPHRFAIYRGGHTGALWDAHLADWVAHAVRALRAA